MSFSFGFEVVVGQDDPAEKLKEKIDADLQAAKTGGYEANVSNAGELDWIDDIEDYIAYIGPKIAREGDTLAVSISGHANPSTEPAEGWASNTVSISLTQRYKPAATAAPAAPAEA